MSAAESQKQGLPPEPAAFSSSSVKDAVRKESLLHPLVLYPAAAGLLSGFAALLYDLPMLFLGMGGLLAMGAATSVVNLFFRRDALAAKYLEQLSESFGQQREQLVEHLGDDLLRCAESATAGHYGKQGVEQYARVEKKLAKLNSLLQKKFKPGELTYGSFLGAAEQVHLSVLDNLFRIVNLIDGAESVDEHYIEERRRELAALKSLDEADQRELNALNKRLSLKQKQLNQVNSLLTENEESMTALDETIAAIADLQTGKGLSDSDLGTAMNRLKEVAARANLFAHQNHRGSDDAATGRLSPPSPGDTP